MAIELKKTIRFEPIKEHCGAYFVEYHAPIEDSWLATVNVVFPQTTSREDAVAAIEAEAERWLRRFAVPVMATAFDQFESVIALSPLRESDNLIVWLGAEGEPRTQWKAETPPSLITVGFTQKRLIETYPRIPHKISSVADKEKRIMDTARRNRLLRNVVIVWFVAIPLAIAIITQFIEWAGWIAFGLSILAGLWKLAKIMGWKKPSKREREKAEGELAMKHHDYYCKRNPEGFARLKVEVLNREIHERIQKEAEELKRKQ